MEYFVIYIVVCLVMGWVGYSTTLGFASAFVLSLILTPVIGFIILLFYPSKEHRDKQLKALNNIANGKDKLNISTADELQKLKSLLDSGTLTPNEFEKAKEKLLS